MSGDLSLAILFFLSGAAGLAFEIVWFYRCSLVFGNTVWAASLALSSFMGGLAIGNGLAGLWIHRIRRLLRAYAVAELLVATSGVAIVYALAHPALLRALETDAQSRLMRFVLTFTALLVPSTAMGATLPFLVAEGHRRRPGFGRVLGRLYGCNTLGAVCGVVIAEAVLIRAVGVAGTAWCAALVDAGVGITALWMSASSEPVEPRTSVPLPTTRTASVLAAAFVSGATLLALEVVWFRFLSMFVLTSTLALSLMLASVLVAIGTGGLIASGWLSRTARAVGVLPALALAAGCITTASYAGFHWWTAGTQVGDWHTVLWFAATLTCPTALISGMLFTFQGEALANRGLAPGRAAAWLTLANTIGATCGPIAATFFMLPALGMERSLFLLAASYALVSVMTWPERERWPRVGRRALAVGATAFVIALAAFPFGLMRRSYFPRSASAYASDGSELSSTREGPSETIFLMQQMWLGRPVYHRLVTNGFSMSGTGVPAMRYMREFVYLPMLLHASPLRRVLVVCYGVGVTAAAATDLAGAESIEVVEISSDVIATSDRIYPPETHPLHDRRVRLHLDDGRYFLATTTERYDLITGEPPPPRTPGAVNIYTREYFRSIRERLSDGGMVTYWLPIGRPNPGTDVDTILRAFCDVFDDCSIWNATPFDVVLLGSRGGTVPVSETAIAAPWRASPALAAHLAEIGFERPEQLLATFLGDAAYVRTLVNRTPPLTDDFPQRLRPTASRASLSDPSYGDDASVRAAYEQVLDPGRARAAFATSPFIRRILPPAVIDGTLPFFDQQRIVNRVLWEGGKPLSQIEDLHTMLTRTSLRTLPLWILGSDAVKQRIGEESTERSGPTEYTRGLGALVARDYRRCGLSGRSRTPRSAGTRRAGAAGVCVMPGGRSGGSAPPRSRCHATQRGGAPFLGLDAANLPS